MSLTGLDTDDDGLDDRFDADNTSAAGTSSFMGNGGTMTGPIAAGSRSTLHKHDATNADRAWRHVAAVLDTKFISISANKQQNSVKLAWAVVNPTRGASYIIERY